MSAERSMGPKRLVQPARSRAGCFRVGVGHLATLVGLGLLLGAQQAAQAAPNAPAAQPACSVFSGVQQFGVDGLVIGRGPLDVAAQGLAHGQGGGVEFLASLQSQLQAHAQPAAGQEADGGCGPGIGLKQCGERLKGFQFLASLLGLFFLGILLTSGVAGLLLLPVLAREFLVDALRTWRDLWRDLRARAAKREAWDKYWPELATTEETRNAA